jgi:hypothetical protein
MGFFITRAEEYKTLRPVRLSSTVRAERIKPSDST